MLVTAISVASFASYVAFYTAYSKSSKTLEFALLLDVFAFRKGIDHTLVELNKALSLAGLTVLLLAFCPGLEESRWGLLWSAMVQVTLGVDTPNVFFVVRLHLDSAHFGL